MPTDGRHGNHLRSQHPPTSAHEEGYGVEIADGAPGLSRGLLSKRLRELERGGVIEILPKPDGHGSTYEPTQAGRELAELMTALQKWGERWAELKPEHAHPGVVLWVWVTFWLNRDRLPASRTLVRFEYPTMADDPRGRFEPTPYRPGPTPAAARSRARPPVTAATRP